MTIVLAISAVFIGVAFGYVVSDKCGMDPNDDKYSVYISFLIIVLVVVAYFILRCVFL